MTALVAIDPVEHLLVEALGDPDAPKKKRRKSSSTYNSRTLVECRKRGWIAGVVERTIPFPKPRGTKIDLFGVIDVVAVDLSAPLGQRTIGIQSTSGGTGGSHSPHRAKILAEPRARDWVAAGNRLELWSWAKQGARGQRKRWLLRVETYEQMVAGAAGSEAA
ncbi:MAG TPA: hypothetical protein VJU58_04020 [Microbacterium sp.]|nr:hypothetical protein [Microbacterium sp.]